MNGTEVPYTALFLHPQVRLMDLYQGLVLPNWKFGLQSKYVTDSPILTCPRTAGLHCIWSRAGPGCSATRSKVAQIWVVWFKDRLGGLGSTLSVRSWYHHNPRSGPSTAPLLHLHNLMSVLVVLFPRLLNKLILQGSFVCFLLCEI